MKPSIHKKAEGRKPHEWVEVVFDSGYLLFLTIAAVIFLTQANGNKSIWLCGVTALVLGGGDAFHLLPRIMVIITGDKKGMQTALGFGKMITSLTMTLVYLLFFELWRELYPGLMFFKWIPTLLYMLAAVRIFLCLMPQNSWIKGTGSVKWSIYRNLPFLLIGISLLLLFTWSAMKYQDGFMFMPLAIFLSFGFYIPVVLFSGKRPSLGALMLPKTAMYIWMIGMGFSLI